MLQFSIVLFNRYFTHCEVGKIKQEGEKSFTTFEQ